MESVLRVAVSPRGPWRAGPCSGTAGHGAAGFDGALPSQELPGIPPRLEVLGVPAGPPVSPLPFHPGSPSCPSRSPHSGDAVKAVGFVFSTGPLKLQNKGEKRKNKTLLFICTIINKEILINS